MENVSNKLPYGPKKVETSLREDSFQIVSLPHNFQADSLGNHTFL